MFFDDFVYEYNIFSLYLFFSSLSTHSMSPIFCSQIPVLFRYNYYCYIHTCIYVFNVYVCIYVSCTGSSYCCPYVFECRHCYFGMGNLWGDISQENWLFLPQQPWTTYIAQLMVGPCMPFPQSYWNVHGYILCTNNWEFMGTTSLSCPEDTISQQCS